MFEVIFAGYPGENPLCNVMFTAWKFTVVIRVRFVLPE